MCFEVEKRSFSCCLLVVIENGDVCVRDVYKEE